MRRGGSENEEGALHVRRLPLNLILTPSPSLQVMAWVHPEGACVKGEQNPGLSALALHILLVNFLETDFEFAELKYRILLICYSTTLYLPKNKTVLRTSYAQAPRKEPELRRTEQSISGCPATVNRRTL